MDEGQASNVSSSPPAVDFLVRKVLRTAMVSDLDIARILMVLHETSGAEDQEAQNKDPSSSKVSMNVDALSSRVLSAMQRLQFAETARQNAQTMFDLASRKVAFLIILAGTGCIGKSYVASHLSERFDIPTMVHTKLVLRFLAAGGDIDPSATTALHTQHWSSHADFLAAHHAQSVHVASVMPIDKVFREKKSVIAEGMQLSPVLFHDLLVERHRHFHESGVFVLPFLLVMDEVNHYFGVHGSLQNRAKSSIPEQDPDLNHDPEKDTLAILSNLQALQARLAEEVQAKDDGWEIVSATQDHTCVANHIHERIIVRAREYLKTTDRRSNLASFVVEFLRPHARPELCQQMEPSRVDTNPPISSVSASMSSQDSYLKRYIMVFESAGAFIRDYSRALFPSKFVRQNVDLFAYPGISPPEKSTLKQKRTRRAK